MQPYDVMSEEKAIKTMFEFMDNSICRRLITALNVARAASPHSITTSPEIPIAEHEYEEVQATHNQTPLRYCDTEWAKSVWEQHVRPGEYWEWLYMGGERGMLAAVVLFGKDKALQELEIHARRTSVVSRTDLMERLNYISGLWKTFNLKDFVAAGAPVRTKTPKSETSLRFVPDPSDRSCAAADFVVEQLIKDRPKARLDRQQAVQVLERLISILWMNADDHVPVSLTELVSAIKGVHHESSIQRRQVARVLALATRDTAECMYPAFCRVQGRHHAKEPDSYILSTEMDKAGFGRI
jgi:hypothetical protein